jgi:glycosyltransferase involved in cell wall biosynthesis
MRIICLIPVFNNASRVGEIVQKCRSQGFEVLVVDDGSTDESAIVSQNAGATVLRFKKNRGKGAALREGFSYIIEKFPQVELIVTLDADGQHDPEDIPRLLEKIRDSNVLVIGSRVFNREEMPPLRLVANRVISNLISALVGLKIRDTQSGFRVIPIRLLKERKFSQSRYAIETEMLFAAKSIGLDIVEVPIKTVYFEKSNFYPRKDLTNLFDILVVCFSRGIPLALTRDDLWKRALLAVLLAFGLLLQFNHAFQPLENILKSGRPIFSKLSPNEKTKENLAVFDWLRFNTPQDAIIFAPRHEGHHIMALADRRAIVSSKVYPSESSNVAARVRDTARFFFTTDPIEAKRILEKYQASYVLIPRARDWFGMCNAIAVCHWVTVARNDVKRSFYAGDLTPEGKRRTMIGKLLSGASTPFLKKIWESPSYLVYRVTDASPQAKCELDPEERQAVVDFVLGRSDSTTLLERHCGIRITFWQDGARRFSAESSADLSLKENIRRLLLNYLGKPGAAEAVELTVYDPAFPKFAATSFVALRGKVRSTKVETLSAAELRSHIRNALDWLLSLERLDGTFRQFIDPQDLDLQESEPRDIAIDALGSWALVEGYAAFRDSKYLDAARRGLEAAEVSIYSGKAVRTNALSFLLMARLRLWEITRDARQLLIATQHRKTLESLITSDYWVPERFKFKNGQPLSVDKEYTKIATHVAFWALTRFDQATRKNPSEKLLKFALKLRHRFLVNRIVKRDLDLAETARLINGFATLVKITSESHYATSSYQIARWLIDFQYEDMLRNGAFPLHPGTSEIDTNSVGRTVEGLVFAGEKFRESVLRGLSWLSSMQYNNEESLYFVPPTELSLLLGGLRSAPGKTLAPLGAAAHFILSGLWYLEH